MLQGFNPRAHTGRDFEGITISQDSELFQSTRPYGARRPDTLIFTKTLKFQSTRPYGARPEYSAHETPISGFNPRAHTGRDMCYHFYYDVDIGFQSTRPYGARLESLSFATHPREVSIHAPIRGATELIINNVDATVVSIHAPIRGATIEYFGSSSIGGFQSTRPYGGAT